MSFFKKIKSTFQEEGLMKELCDHLRTIGVNATLLESGSSEAVGRSRSSGMILGSVKLDGRNIDLVQVERIPTQLVYQYRYIVQADVEGIEKKLEAKGEPKKKGFMSKEIVDYKWDGQDLAHRLNDDSDLRKMLLTEGLEDVVATPTEAPWAEHVYHQYTIRLADRDGLWDHLRHNDIGCGVYYPHPLSEVPILEGKVRVPEEPVIAKALSEAVLSLPVHPGLSGQEIETVIMAVRGHLR